MLTILLDGLPVEYPEDLIARLRGARPPEGFASNGMGPQLGGSRLGRWLSRTIPDSWHGADVSAAAAYHDWAYSGAPGGTWADRRAADLNLALNSVQCCLYAVECGRASLWRLPQWSILACLYWRAVRIGGWASFNWQRGERPRGRVEKWRERSGLFLRRLDVTRLDR